MKSVLHKSSKAADSVTVERQPGMAFSANCNLDEYHVSPTMADAHVCHDPRTGVWGRIGDGSQNGLGNVCGEQSHPSYFRQPVRPLLGPKVLSWLSASDVAP